MADGLRSGDPTTARGAFGYRASGDLPGVHSTTAWESGMRTTTIDAAKWERWWDYLTSPRDWCFLTLNRYSAEWDAALLDLMDKHTFERKTKHTAYLGGVCIWIANHPYSSMHPYDLDVRASRATTHAAWRKLVRETCSTPVTTRAQS